MALKVAAGMLAACSPDTGVRIIGFVGGPCTDGPGVIVAKELTDPIRSHKDLAKDAATHYNKAVKFYEALATQLVSQGHVLDIFACAVDQVGISSFAFLGVFVRVMTYCSDFMLCTLHVLLHWIYVVSCLQRHLSNLLFRFGLIIFCSDIILTLNFLRIDNLYSPYV